MEGTYKKTKFLTLFVSFECLPPPTFSSSPEVCHPHPHFPVHSYSLPSTFWFTFKDYPSLDGPLLHN